MLVVGLAGACLSNESLLASDCKFSDVARLFVALLRGAESPGMPLDVIGDGMLLSVVQHDRGCAVCDKGFYQSVAAIKFVNCHHKQLLREYQPDVVVVFGQEAAQLYSGENVFSVTWPAPSARQVERICFGGRFTGRCLAPQQCSGGLWKTK